MKQVKEIFFRRWVPDVNIQILMITNVIRWFLVRYLNFADHHSTIIRKIDKGFERKLDFKDKKIPVKIRDIHKIEKKNVSASVFLVMRIK